jgi:hypothetical protein
MATRPLQPQDQELTGFTREPSDQVWTITPADAQAVVDSWEAGRAPGQELKSAYGDFLRTVRQS